MQRGSRRPGVLRVAGAWAAAALALSACGSDAPATTSAQPAQSEEATASFPVTVEADNGSVTIERQPEAIVSLSPTATEMLFAIGAGDQVVAVDDQSDFPEGVPTTDLSGFEPNVEAIASYEPDLVVFATEPGDLESSLEQLQIPALQQDAVRDFEGVYEQIEELGMITGRVAEAEELAADIRSDIAYLVSSTPDATGLSYYHELDQTYFTANSESFIGEVYAQLGLSNIADAAKGASSGYVQLSEEYILDSDPDLIFLADSECCGQTPGKVSARPGWNQITAIRNANVVPVPDDIASRWGPRVVDFLQIVSAAVMEAQNK